MKKTPPLSMQKFTSTAVYFCILSTGLTMLLKKYGETSSKGDNVLMNPLVFACAVLLLGISTSLIYWAISCLLKVLMSAILKKETNMLNALNVEESTLIGVVASVVFGVICLVLSDGDPDLKFMHQLFFSLPIAKFAFITTSIGEMKTTIIELLEKSVKVWPFLVYVIIYVSVILFFERYASLINAVITIVVVVLLFHIEAKRTVKNKNRTDKSRNSKS